MAEGGEEGFDGSDPARPNRVKGEEAEDKEDNGMISKLAGLFGGDDNNTMTTMSPEEKAKAEKKAKEKEIMDKIESELRKMPKGDGKGIQLKDVTPLGPTTMRTTMPMEKKLTGMPPMKPGKDPKMDGALGKGAKNVIKPEDDHKKEMNLISAKERKQKEIEQQVKNKDTSSEKGLGVKVRRKILNIQKKVRFGF